MATTPVTLICGPPLSGKTTFVRSLIQPGELMIDTDAIGSALSGQPEHATPDNLVRLAFAVKDALFLRILGTQAVPMVYLIEPLPDPVMRMRIAAKWNASRVVVLPIPAVKCYERLAASCRPSNGIDWKGLIERLVGTVPGRTVR